MRMRIFGKYMAQGILIVALGWSGCTQYPNEYNIYEKRARESYLRQQKCSRPELGDIIVNLNKAIELAPHRVSTESYYIRSICWYSIGEYDRANQDRMVIFKREPNNPERVPVYVAIAGELAVKGKYQEAMKYIERSIKLAPNYAPSRATRALLYINMGMYDKWEEEIRNAIELDANITNTIDVKLIRHVAERKMGENEKGHKGARAIVREGNEK